MKRVLVVDDEPDAVAYLTALLEDHSYQVRSAHNVERAMELIEQEMPDLLLVDVMMPGASGLNLVRQVRCRPEWAGVPVIVVTGKVDVIQDQFRSYLDRFRVRPPEGIAEKPFDPDGLLRMIKNVLYG